mmetsp:Transcript_6860/g.9850  ORF Transcript_6860/g.9850 Transcript_6860/m.9850 type:complete len:98 (-) Transcript_6860:72-365(-)
MLPIPIPKLKATSSDLIRSDVNVNVKSKVIYVVRSPMDTCLSFYYHLSQQEEGCYEKPLGDFFQEWVDGKIPFGSWTDHLLSPYAPMIARGEVLEVS